MASKSENKFPFIYFTLFGGLNFLDVLIVRIIWSSIDHMIMVGFLLESVWEWGHDVHIFWRSDNTALKYSSKGSINKLRHALGMGRKFHTRNKQRTKTNSQYTVTVYKILLKFLTKSVWIVFNREKATNFFGDTGSFLQILDINFCPDRNMRLPKILRIEISGESGDFKLRIGFWTSGWLR